MGGRGGEGEGARGRKEEYSLGPVITFICVSFSGG